MQRVARGAQLFRRHWMENLLAFGSMIEPKAPKLSKWPFLLSDLILLGLAGGILQHYPHPLERWPLLLLTLCVVIGAWVTVLPFLTEYRAEVKFAETDSLTSAVEQINHLRTLTNQISFATAQWQVVQDQSGKTVATAKEITELITTEGKAFVESLQKCNDAERAHLRLEVEKLRRGEGEWVESLVRLFDHIYAVYLAGARSGQPNLQAQLGQFQNACREAVRRLGFIPFEAASNQPFDQARHQVLEPESKPMPGTPVEETLATGYTFQGQLLRCALVSLKPDGSEPGLSVGEQLSLREED